VVKLDFNYLNKKDNVIDITFDGFNIADYFDISYHMGECYSESNLKPLVHQQKLNFDPQLEYGNSYPGWSYT
jgi:hypothetical protein